MYMLLNYKYFQLFRHGNRAPGFKCNTDPHKNTFPEGIMELTKVRITK